MDRAQAKFAFFRGFAAARCCAERHHPAPPGSHNVAAARRVALRVPFGILFRRFGKELGYGRGGMMKEPGSATPIAKRTCRVTHWRWKAPCVRKPGRISRKG
jgi:hypothetical protein